MLFVFVRQITRAWLRSLVVRPHLMPRRGSLVIRRDPTFNPARSVPVTQWPHAVTLSVRRVVRPLTNKPRDLRAMIPAMRPFLPAWCCIIVWVIAGRLAPLPLTDTRVWSQKLVADDFPSRQLQPSDFARREPAASLISIVNFHAQSGLPPDNLD